MKYSEIRDAFQDKPLFTRSDLVKYLCIHKPDLKDSSVGWLLYDLQKHNVISHIAHNSYKIHTDEKPLRVYKADLSDKVIDITSFIKKKYPEVAFIVWETHAYNEFANHQLWRNFIFVEAEKWLEESVFNALCERIENRVLFKPSKKEIVLYSEDATVSVLTLTSEAPICDNQARLEKLLVDLFANPLVDRIVSRGDYPGIYKEAFLKYKINYKMMLRYARRRGKADEIMSFMENETNIKMVGGIPL